MLHHRLRQTLLLTALSAVLFALPAFATFEFIGDIEAGVDPATGVYVRFETIGSGTSEVEYTSQDGITYQTQPFVSLDGWHNHLLTAAQPDTTYTYRIRLADWSGNTMIIEEKVLQTPAFVSPQDLSAIAYEEAVQLFWNPTFASAEYILERRLSENDAFEHVAILAGPQYLDTSLTSGASYAYRLISRDAQENDADPSDPVTVSLGPTIARADNVPTGIALLHSNFSSAKDVASWQITFPASLVHDDDLNRDVLEVASGTTTYAFAEGYVGLPAGTETIAVSSLARFEDVVLGENPWDAGRVHITFHDATGSHIESFGWPELALWEGTNEWGWYSRLFEVPEGATEVRLFAGLHSTSGMVRFAEMIVHAYDAAGLPL